MALVEESRKLLRTHPLCQPTTKQGWPMKLKVSSWGSVGWFGKDGEYSYLQKHPVNGLFWPAVPQLIKECVGEALDIVGEDPEMTLDTVLLNWYQRGDGKLGRHQDVTEQDQTSPIVTISLGDSCLFNIGSTDYRDKGVDVILDSGDVVVMAGPSRLAYHGVTKLRPVGNSIIPSGGRISLTARKVFK